MALSNPVFPYARELSLKQNPLLYEDGRPVLADAGFFARLERDMIRARMPETAAERFYEAYEWRDKAQSAYAELTHIDTELADFEGELQETQRDLEYLMTADYETLMHRLNDLDKNERTLSDNLDDYSIFLAKQATDIRFEKISDALRRLEKSLLAKEAEISLDADFNAADVNVMETPRGMAERDSFEAERHVDEGMFEVDFFDTEKLDFLH